MHFKPIPSDIKSNCFKDKFEESVGAERRRKNKKEKKKDNNKREQRGGSYKKREKKIKVIVLSFYS